jgi:hypothetical protein
MRGKKRGNMWWLPRGFSQGFPLFPSFFIN